MASGSPDTSNKGATLAEPPASLIAASCRHLRRLGLLGADETPSWRLLGGGVSNWVVLFECGRSVSREDGAEAGQSVTSGQGGGASWGQGVVVKGALARLRVADEWLADPRRAVLEGRAMQALGQRLPDGYLPRVLFVDDDAYLLGMSRAPVGAYPWKEALLRGEVETETARAVGALLGRMHAVAWDDGALAQEFADLTLFRQLRLDPYHERAAQVAEGRGEGDLAALLRAGAAEMTRQRVTLVHGDFSPKNLLVHPGGMLALDFEVVHWGNPDFDTAFLLTHLALKAAHRPGDAAGYGAAARAFFDGYAAALRRRSGDEIERGALRQVGCLLLARADGKSPAEYLDAAGRERARALGAAVLRGAITQVPELFTTVQML